jgi:hypothetical protein
MNTFSLTRIDPTFTVMSDMEEQQSSPVRWYTDLRFIPMSQQHRAADDTVSCTGR